MKTVQLDIISAIEARDAGIAQAIDHANDVSNDWSERAYMVLQDFLNIHVGDFMVEELRSYAALIDFEIPPSSRAWGGIIRKAAFAGLVEKVGVQNTTNVKSHCTPASVWRKK